MLCVQVGRRENLMVHKQQQRDLGHILRVCDVRVNWETVQRVVPVSKTKASWGYLGTLLSLKTEGREDPLVASRVGVCRA